MDVNLSDIKALVQKGLEITGSYAILAKKSGVSRISLRRWYHGHSTPHLGSFFKFRTLVEQMEEEEGKKARADSYEIRA